MNSHPANLDSLHYLRALGVVFVLLYHLNTYVIPGQFAIDMFFVISGYVMSMILTKKISPFQFLAARIIRVVPLYWATTLLVFILAALMPHMVKIATANPEFLIKSLFFIPFFKEANNIAPLHTVGWTLMFEVFFYLLLFGGLVLNKYVSSKINVLFFAFSMSFIVYFVANLFTFNDPVLKFLQSQNLVVNAYGILAFWINTHYTSHSPLAKKLYLPIVGLLFVFFYFVDFDYAHIRALSLAIPCFIIVVLFSRAEMVGLLNVNKYLHKVTMFIADTSLSIYLTHIFIFLAQERFLAKYYPIFQLNTVFGAIVVLTTSVIVGALVHYLYDDKMNKYFRGKLKLMQRTTEAHSKSNLNSPVLKQA